MGEIIKPTRDFLGRGLIAPLRRVGPADYLVASGVPLIRACLQMIIETRQGELPWNPDFGLSIDKLRNKPNTEDLAALVAADIEAAIRRWEPRVDLLKVTVKRTGETLIATINWAII